MAKRPFFMRIILTTHTCAHACTYTCTHNHKRHIPINAHTRIHTYTHTHTHIRHTKFFSHPIAEVYFWRITKLSLKSQKKSTIPCKYTIICIFLFTGNFQATTVEWLLQIKYDKNAFNFWNILPMLFWCHSS